MNSRRDAVERARHRVDLAAEHYGSWSERAVGERRLESLVEALRAYDVAAAVALREAPSQQERARALALREAAF